MVIAPAILDLVPSTLVPITLFSHYINNLPSRPDLASYYDPYGNRYKDEFIGEYLTFYWIKHED